VSNLVWLVWWILCKYSYQLGNISKCVYLGMLSIMLCSYDTNFCL
jgi:hypothetical protein